MTVTEAFSTFKSNLELADREQDRAARTQEALRERIANHIYIARSFLSGSYVRHTKISPLNDIDVILVRNDQPAGLSTDGSGVRPDQAIRDLAVAAKMAYPASTVERQSRSVNVQLQGIGFGFDLVPAWRRSPDGYWIPDTDTGSWLPTNPEWHAELLTQAHKSSGEKLKPVIKMMKHWSRKNFDLLRSFHIELICKDVFSGESIETFQIGVATALVRLPRYVGVQMLDPAYGSSRIDKPLSEDDRNRLQRLVEHDSTQAIEALRAENGGNHAAALEIWEKIFINGFPTD